MSAEEELGSVGIARRAVGRAESQRASRAWWDADADDYLAEHGADIGDVDFVWCPEGLREADAQLLGDVAGRRVLEVGCGSRAVRAVARHPGAGRSPWTCPRGMLRHAAALNTAADVVAYRWCRPVPSGCPSPTASSTSRAPRSARCRSWPSRTA